MSSSNKQPVKLEPWAEIQKKTFTNWVNVHLADRQMKIGDLATDLTDGLSLINLLEIISAKRLPKYNKVCKFHNMKLENVGIALKFCKDEGLKLVAIGPEDVVECRINLILGLIWTIILRWQIQKIQYQEGGAPDKKVDNKAELLAWVNKMISPHVVKNFSKDWHDGLALALLCQSLGVDVAMTPGEEPVELVKKAVEAASNQLSIAAVISPEDIVSPHLDDLSMMTYISMFRNQAPLIKVQAEPVPEPVAEPAIDPTEPDLTKFTVSGPGLRNPVARRKNRFDVISKNKAGDHLPSGGLDIRSKFAHKEHSDNHHNAKVHDANDGTYNVSYIPTSPGEYLIYVSLMEQGIADSPFSVTVAAPTDIDAAHTEINTEVKKDDVKVDESAEEEVFFEVITRDSNGDQIPKGGAAINAVIVNLADGVEIETHIEDYEDGKYGIWFTSPAVGRYAVSAGLPDDKGEGVSEHMHNSPFEFEKLADGSFVAYPKAGEVHSGQVGKEANEKGQGKRYFKASTQDKRGKPVHVKGHKIFASVTPISEKDDSHKRGPFYIFSRATDDVLTAKTNQAGSTVVTDYKEKDNENQLWIFTDDDHIQNVGTGLVFDITPNPVSGGKVEVHGHQGDLPTQRWKYNPATEFIESQKRDLVLESGRKSARSVDDEEEIDEDEDRRPEVTVRDAKHTHSNKPQRWYLVYKKGRNPVRRSSGKFYIYSRANDKALTHGEDGTLTVERKSSKQKRQLWEFTPEGFVVSVDAEFVLALDSGYIAVQKKNKKNPQQKWKYDPFTETLVSSPSALSLSENHHSLSAAEVNNDSIQQKWYLVDAHEADEDVDADVEDLGDGNYEIVFKNPVKKGKFNVSVGTPNEADPTTIGTHYVNSPFVADLSPSSTEGGAHNQSTLNDKPEDVHPSGEIVYKATVKDNEGNVVTSPTSSRVGATAVDSTGKEIPVTVRDNKDGTHSIIIPAGHKVSFPLHLSVGLTNEDGDVESHFINSPLTVTAEDAAASGIDASKSTVSKKPKVGDKTLPGQDGAGAEDSSASASSGGDDDDDGDEEKKKRRERRKAKKDKKKADEEALAAAPSPVSFRVTTRDSQGRPLTKGGLPVVAKVTDANGNDLPVKIVDNGDGTYDIIVDVPQSGPVNIDAGLSDDNDPNNITERFKGVPFTTTVDLEADDQKDAHFDLSPAVKFAKSDRKPYLEVISYKKNGKKYKKGGLNVLAKAPVISDLEDIVLEVLGEFDDVDALIRASSHIPAGKGAHVKDNNKGTYRVYFADVHNGADYLVDVGTANEEEDGAGAGHSFGSHAKHAPTVITLNIPHPHPLDVVDLQHSEADLSKLGQKTLKNGDIYFPIQTKDKDGNKVHVGGLPLGASINVNGKDVPAEVKDNGDGTYTVAFPLAQLPAIYEIAVALENDDGSLSTEPHDQLKDSVFVVELGPEVEGSDPRRPSYAKVVERPDANNTTVDGPGIVDPKQDRPNRITIHPRDANGDKIKGVPAFVEATITGPNGEQIPIVLTPNKDGTLSGDYTPTDNGAHIVSVGLKQKDGSVQPVNGSPFHVHVSPSADASKSVLEVPEVLETGVSSSFTVRTFDKHGAPLTAGGEKLYVKIQKSGILGAIASFLTTTEVVDNNDGTYSIPFSPSDAGKYTVTAKIGKENVQNSPKEVEVEEGADEGNSEAVDFMFTIEAKTASGAPRRRGGDKFEVSITGPDGPVDTVRVETVEGEPHKYRVYYTLPGAGKFTIKATLNGKDIKGSPWKQKI